MEVARIPSPQEIIDHQTSNGGWTRHDLNMWGVQWPPRDGWKEELIKAHKAGFTVGVVLECIACREMKFFVDYDNYPICEPCKKADEEKFKRTHPELYLDNAQKVIAHQVTKRSFAERVKAAFTPVKEQRYKKQPIPDDFRWAVFERDNFTCQVCGSRRKLAVDHIVPESKGGKLTMDNAQTLCKSCNSKKGAK